MAKKVSPLLSPFERERQHQTDLWLFRARDANLAKDEIKRRLCYTSAITALTQESVSYP